jgi:hypothetical protein
MIPPDIHPGCASPGEHEIFRRLKDSPGTQNWIVLHSLDVSNHLKRIYGEIDFVVIVYGSSTNPDFRGPFKQAAEAMHSIRKKLSERRPDLAGVVFWSAVIFPYIAFSASSSEWREWQVIDNRIFRMRPLGKLIESILDHARSFLRECTSAKWFQAGSAEPNAEQCEIISHWLRPDFEFYQSPKSRAKTRSEELKRYTEEQFVALDAMEENMRVAFTGPAGTGKTLLAIEAARRGRSANRRVLMLCFNRILGKWLKAQTENLGPGVVCKTLHGHMLSVSGYILTGKERGGEFWKDELPLLAMEKLTENPDEKYLFDEIVLDEAQDIAFCKGYLDFLDLSLKGGLASGRWRFFGDFERQAIYGQALAHFQELLSMRVGQAPIYSLRVNCRNTPRIASVARLLGGLNPDYQRVLRPDDGVDPELHYYSSDANQRMLLIQAFEKLYREGFTGGDIIVLSSKADASCIAASISISPWRERLRPVDNAGEGHIEYCTIHAFKGMEKPSVIVTDIQRVATPLAESLFYVAVTRALNKLEVLVEQSAKEEIISALLNFSGNKR